jgi:hypothetical protein
MVARCTRLDAARTREIACENASEGRPGVVLLARVEQGAPVRRLESEHMAGSSSARSISPRGVPAPAVSTSSLGW